ncbi:MAG: TerB family tellurite resistance protein [Kofleriaceae bacterium]|nr:TerB family tellurite resistance protein [Kofleriaceae bacterium]
MTERLANEAFLEGAVTCAFVIAAADGHASEEEYDALLDRLEILGGVDRDKVDELLTVATNELESAGFEPRIARVAELVTEREAAEAALRLGLAIALADDDVSAQEREIATQLAKALRLEALSLDDVITELRG